MRIQGIYINVSRRNDDLPEMIEEYSEKFNLSKADTVAEILRAYPKLVAYKHRVKDITNLNNFNQVVDWENSSFYHATNQSSSVIS